jgi:hypothetical protein
MKRKRVLFSILLALALLVACNQKAKKVKAYHDDLVHSVHVVVDSSLEFGDAITSHDKSRTVRAVEQFSSLLDKTTAAIKAKGDYEGDAALKYNALKLLYLYRTSLDGDFMPFLSGMNSNSFTAQESFVADSLYAKFNMAEKDYWEKFNVAEKKFCEQHGLNK